MHSFIILFIKEKGSKIIVKNDIFSTFAPGRGHTASRIR